MHIHEDATPKTILEQMNAPKLSRGNVASHLQKFREYCKKTENDTQADLTHSRHLINNMRRPSLTPTGYPSHIYKHPQGSFQYGVLQQNRLRQPRFGAPVGPSRFLYNNVGNNSFIHPTRYGQLGPLSNNGNTELRMGNGPSITQQTFGGYQNFGLGEPLCVYNSNCGSNPVQRIVNQQPQGRPEFCHIAPLGENFNHSNSLGQNSNPCSANLDDINTGSFQIPSPSPTLYLANDCPSRNNYAIRQMPYPVASDVNPTGAYVGEMSTINNDAIQMHEILKGKKPMEESNMSSSVLICNNVSTNTATQGESSSGAILNLEKFQVVPPAQQQFEGQEYYDLLNLTKNTSPCDPSEIFEQGIQFPDQVLQRFCEGQMRSEGILDYACDPSEFLLNSPENNLEQEPLNKDRLDLENNLELETENKDRLDSE